MAEENVERKVERVGTEFSNKYLVQNYLQMILGNIHIIDSRSIASSRIQVDGQDMLVCSCPAPRFP